MRSLDSPTAGLALTGGVPWYTERKAGQRRREGRPLPEPEPGLRLPSGETVPQQELAKVLTAGPFPFCAPVGAASPPWARHSVISHRWFFGGSVSCR